MFNNPDSPATANDAAANSIENQLKKNQIIVNLFNNLNRLLEAASPGITQGKEESFFDTLKRFNGSSAVAFFNLRLDSEISGAGAEDDNKILPPSDAVLAELKNLGLNFENKDGHPSFILTDVGNFITKNYNKISDESAKYLSDLFNTAIKKNQKVNETGGSIFFVIQTAMFLLGVAAAVLGAGIVPVIALIGSAMTFTKIGSLLSEAFQVSKTAEAKPMVATAQTQLQSLNSKNSSITSQAVANFSAAAQKNQQNTTPETNNSTDKNSLYNLPRVDIKPKSTSGLETKNQISIDGK